MSIAENIAKLREFVRKKSHMETAESTLNVIDRFVNRPQIRATGRTVSWNSLHRSREPLLDAAVHFVEEELRLTQIPGREYTRVLLQRICIDQSLVHQTGNGLHCECAVLCEFG